MRGPFPSRRAPLALLLLAACAPAPGREAASAPGPEPAEDVRLLALAAASWDVGLDDDVAAMGADWGSWSIQEPAAEPRLVAGEGPRARLATLAWETRFDGFRREAVAKGPAEVVAYVEDWERSAGSWRCARRRRALRPDGTPLADAADAVAATRAGMEALESCSRYWMDPRELEETAMRESAAADPEEPATADEPEHADASREEPAADVEHESAARTTGEWLPPQHATKPRRAPEQPRITFTLLHPPALLDQDGDAARLLVSVREVRTLARTGWLPRLRTVHLVEGWERADGTWTRKGAVPVGEYVDHYPEHEPSIRRWVERRWD